MPTTYRSTGLIATLVDENLNSWEDFAGTDINVDVAYQFYEPASEEWEQAHWRYRGQAGMCARTTDDAIVRVRIGDGSTTNWNVYRQIITDPTDSASWESWTLLYSGTHYAIAIEADATAGAGYRVYTAKSDGLYMDNALKITKAGIIRIKPTIYNPGLLYFQTVHQDAGDSERMVKWWYTPNVRITTPVTIEDCVNYRWYRSDMVCMGQGAANTYVGRFRALAFEGAMRERETSQVLLWEDGELARADQADDEDSFNVYNGVRFLKGPSGQAGYKTFENLYVTVVGPEGAQWYYLFYTERHFDVNGAVSSNLKYPLFWSRSEWPFKAYQLTQATPVGFSIWGFAGAVEWGDYMYVGGNGRVVRRPTGEVETDLTDYVIEGDYDIPRDNQKATAKLLLANPNNTVGAYLGLTDADAVGLTERRLELAIAQSVPGTDTYTYKREEDWRISSIRKIQEISGNQVRKQIEIELGNFWHRMENPFRDTINLFGQFTWADWQEDAANQLYNYHNDTDEFIKSIPEENYIGLRTIFSNLGTITDLGGKSITLFAGWRGENAMVRAMLWGNGGLVFRYVDKDNFYYARFVSNDTIKLIRYQNGEATELASRSAGHGLPVVLTVNFRWSKIDIDVAFGNNPLNHTLTEPQGYTGFVGWVSEEVTNFTVEEYNAPLNTASLINQLLALADEHEAELELDEETAGAEVIDLMLGPQSDLDSPGKALRQVLEASNLQVVWLEN